MPFDEWWDTLHSVDPDTLSTLHSTTHEAGGGDYLLGAWAYEFIQATPATTWVIAHNLGGYPSVTATDGAGVVLVAQTVYDSINQVTVTFSTATSGKAYLS